jgi:hypothetical protein
MAKRFLEVVEIQGLLRGQQATFFFADEDAEKEKEAEKTKESSIDKGGKIDV